LNAQELALEMGNQILMSIIARRESYQNYLHFIEKYNSAAFGHQSLIEGNS
jgi:hypothetical protein